MRKPAKNQGTVSTMLPLGTLAFLLIPSLPGTSQTPTQPQTPPPPARTQPRNQTGTPQPTAVQLDPANLAGERVRANSVAKPIAANTGATALATTLRRLGTRASLMMIVAHPDDEDGGMLTYESRGKGARVAMLTLNRGEGGQNMMSADFYDALGLDRTQELLAADRYMGIDQMFGSVVDFGFSKTKEEALAKWGHQRVLYDAVRAVRLYRPLVLASVFVGGVTDGHGHHQVAGQIDQEVFTAAADPKMFPEMNLPPWAPLKVYARIPFARIDDKGMYDYATNKYAPTKFTNYVSGTVTNTVPKANVTVPEGDVDPLLGVSYFQFAREGLGLQKSQIGKNARPGTPGAHDSAYHRYASRLGQADGETSGPETGFFDGIDTSLTGIASSITTSDTERTTLKAELAKLQSLVTQAQAAFKPDTFEAVAPFLRDGLIAIADLQVHVRTSNITAAEKNAIQHELRVKHTQFNDALIEALSVTLEVVPACGGPLPKLPLTPGDKLPLAVRLIHQEESHIEGIGITIESATGTELSSEAPSHTCTTPAPALPADTPADQLPDQITIAIPSDAKPTRPYFSRSNIEQPFYDLAVPALRDAPITPYPLVAVARFRYSGLDLVMRQVVQGADGPVVIVPPVSVSLSPGAGIIPLTEKTLSLTTHVRSDGPEAKGTLRLELPAGWTSAPAVAPVEFTSRGAQKYVTFTITPGKLVPGTEYTLTAVADVAGHQYREGYRSAGYAGLQATNLYRPATYRAFGADVKVAPDLKVAYIQGTGDEIPASLENIGIHATILDPANITAAALKPYDTVVLGVRTYEAHPDLAAASPALKAFAEAGGVVIVQYAYRDLPEDVSPYPLALGSREIVVEETAPVKLLDPASPLVNFPNKITEHDFDKWVEERGHGFMETWDSKFQPIFETHDQGQSPQKGGLLVAPVGKGFYVYAALALYRQLPEGVPGAYRLYANLLSLGKASAAK